MTQMSSCGYSDTDGHTLCKTISAFYWLDSHKTASDLVLGEHCIRRELNYRESILISVLTALLKPTFLWAFSLPQSSLHHLEAARTFRSGSAL